MKYPELGKLPIPGDNPTGEDVKYDDLFMDLQVEIDKLLSPTEIETFSWNNVIESASEILSNRSKDLFAAAYLGAGLVAKNNTQGLMDSIQIFHDLLHEYWDTLFPGKKKINRRISAITWWIDRIETEVNSRGLNLQKISPEQGTRILADLEAIDIFLKDKSDITVPVSKLNIIIKEIIEEPQSEEDTEHDDSSADGQQDQSRDQKTRIKSGKSVVQISDEDKKKLEEYDQKFFLDKPDSIETSSQAKKNIRNAFNYIKELAQYVSKQDLTDPSPYRLIRVSLWQRVKKLPLLKTEEVSVLPAPDPETRKKLQELYENESWNDLVSYAEELLLDNRHIFYLDINWYSASALEKLGDEYMGAYDAICNETLNFLSHMPESTINLYFRDETPYANNETRKWVHHLKCKNNPINQDVVQTEFTTDELEIEVRETVIKLIRKKNIKDSLKLFQEKIKNCSSEKESFLWKIGLVNFLDKKDKKEFIEEYLENINSTIKKCNLTQWEPKLASYGLETLYHIYKGLPDENNKLKAKRILGQIAKIDIISALNT